MLRSQLSLRDQFFQEDNQLGEENIIINGHRDSTILTILPPPKFCTLYLHAVSWWDTLPRHGRNLLEGTTLYRPRTQKSSNSGEF